MNYIKQIGVIFLFTYGSEALVSVFNIAFPGSILGMLLLFIALKLGLFKVEVVKDAGNFLLSILPIMFVPLGVGIMEYFDVLRDKGLEIAVIITITTVVVMVVTGRIVQGIKKGRVSTMLYNSPLFGVAITTGIYIVADTFRKKNRDPISQSTFSFNYCINRAAFSLQDPTGVVSSGRSVDQLSYKTCNCSAGYTSLLPL